MTRLPLSVVVPARNEAETIGSVVRNLLAMDWVSEVVVVDNNSDDETAALAEAAGARSVFEAQPGMGHAVRAGLAAATHDWVMKVDADLEKFNVKLFSEMAAARVEGVGLVKGDWTDPKDNMPMTRLLVKPGLRWLFQGLSTLRSPNTGIYLVNRSLIAHQEIVGDYAADLDIMVRIYAAGARVVEVDIGRIEHDMRNVGHYNKMAETIMGFLLQCQSMRITEELVVLARSAEEVLQSAFGLCAGRAKAGGVVTIFVEDAATCMDALGGCLEKWPTLRVLALDRLEGFAPFGPERHVQILTSSAPAIKLLADGLQSELRKAGARVEPTLVMPTDPDAPCDHGFDISSVSDLKSAALAHAGLLDTHKTRECFQSLDILLRET